MANAKDISIAIKQICEEKGIPFESVIESIEAALAVAYRKEMSKKGKDIRVEFNPNDASMRVFEVYTVVENELFAEYEEEQKALEALEAEAEKAGKTLEELQAEMAAAAEAAKSEEEKAEEAAAEENEDAEEEEPKKRYNPKTDISLAEALEESDEIEIGDEIRDELELPEEFGRMAAQTAKQVIIQKLREAERETLYNTYKDQAGEVINAMVQRVEGRVVFVDLGQAVAVMPPSEQIRGEVYKANQRIKVLLLSIEKTNKGPEIVASRSHPDLVAALFTAEVPEIASGSVEIKGVAREAGSRTKIAVTASDPSIDPIGSCVGQRGTRVQTVINELGGEKIDIIEYDEDDVKFIVNAMSPAKIVSVELNETEEGKQAVAEVQDDQFSLAIGKSGQNVRLASRLAGWSIDVQKLEGEGGSEEDSEEAGTTDDTDSNEDSTDGENETEEKVEATEVAAESDDNDSDDDDSSSDVAEEAEASDEEVSEDESADTEEESADEASEEDDK